MCGLFYVWRMPSSLQCSVLRDCSKVVDKNPVHYLLCEPSQSGGLPVALQPQKNTCLEASATYFTGLNSEPLWAPSQNGCFLLLPQAHQKYFLPASTSTAKGVSEALTGLAAVILGSLVGGRGCVACGRLGLITVLLI